jgi:hypothetical protein
MSNGKNQVNSIDWMALFSFSHIFKSFRIAIHPSKIMLGLAAVISIYLAGSTLDFFWGICGQSVPNEDIVTYLSNSDEAYGEALENWREGKVKAAVALKYKYEDHATNLNRFVGSPGLGQYLKDALRKKVDELNTAFRTDRDQSQIDAQIKIDLKKDDWGPLLDDASDEVGKIRQKIDKILDGAYEEAAKAITAKALDDKDEAKAVDELDEGLANAKRVSVQLATRLTDEVASINGKQVFESFLEYQSMCLTNALRAVRYGNFTTGMDDYEGIISAKTIRPLNRPRAIQEFNGMGKFTGRIRPAGTDDSPGFLFWMLMACQGLIWLMCEHWLFAIIFLTFSLSAWSLFGGAIHRIAALHAAREEKISMVQALRFSASKFLSFFAAPLIPLIIILCLGLVLFLGGLILGNLGVYLTWIMGLLLPIAIVLGLLIAFLSIGLGGGCGLMYPTIAVEGSDAFDAISRSFSYVFARPWRTGLYGLIALVYGTICYLFVRLFAFIALASTHWFVKGGIFGGGSDLSSNADALDKLWPAPMYTDFHPPVSGDALAGFEPLAAWLISVWVCIVIGVVAAFALSFMASSSTVIYYLLRRKVDATDLDDVYVEESEEELAGEVAEALAEQETEEEAPAADEAPEADEEADEEASEATQEPEESDESDESKSE